MTSYLGQFNPAIRRMVNDVKQADEPSLLLDFANGAHHTVATSTFQFVTDLDRIWTFTRSSDAWYWDANGVLQKATADEARFDHDPATGEPLGLLIEEQRTNELLDNRDLSTGNWGVVNGSISQDQTGVDGVANKAWTVTDNDTANTSRFNQSVSVNDDSATHTCVWFVKKDSDESRFPQFAASLFGGSAIRHRVQINTKTGDSFETSDFNNDGFSVEDAGGWWRVVLQVTNDTSGNTTLTYRAFPAWTATLGGSEDVSATGSIVYDFGQVELNATFATSPILTGGSPVTRAADIPKLTEVNSSGWFNQSEGTWVATFVLGTAASETRIITEAATRIIYVFNGIFRSFDGNTTGPEVGTATVGAETTIGIAIDKSSRTMSANGNSPKTEDSHSGELTDLSTVSIGIRAGGNLAIFGHIKRFDYYPRRLSNTELKELTQ